MRWIQRLNLKIGVAPPLSASRTSRNPKSKIATHPLVGLPCLERQRYYAHPWGLLYLCGCRRPTPSMMRRCARLTLTSALSAALIGVPGAVCFVGVGSSVPSHLRTSVNAVVPQHQLDIDTRWSRRHRLGRHAMLDRRRRRDMRLATMSTVDEEEAIAALALSKVMESGQKMKSADAVRPLIAACFCR